MTSPPRTTARRPLPPPPVAEQPAFSPVAAPPRRAGSHTWALPGLEPSTRDEIEWLYRQVSALTGVVGGLVCREWGVDPVSDPGPRRLAVDLHRSLTVAVHAAEELAVATGAVPSDHRTAEEPRLR